MKDPTLIRQLLRKYGSKSFPTSCWIDAHVELLQFASLSLKWDSTRGTSPMIVGMSVYIHYLTDISPLIYIYILHKMNADWITSQLH